jgi:hypothetical protein
VLQALTHFVAMLPTWLLGAVQWIWINYFHHDGVVIACFAVAVLALIIEIRLALRGPGGMTDE